MLRTYRDRAIVLRAYDLGEADRIVILLGRASGQIRAVAKGVRRTSSKFGARLSSFNLVDLQLHRGANLHTVTQAETIAAYASGIGRDYVGFTNAKLIAEAAQKLTEVNEGPSIQQFDLLHGAIHSLAANSHPSALVSTAYLLRSMAIEGWQPTLASCAECGTDGELRFFQPQQGGAFCESCAPDGSIPTNPATLRLMNSLLHSEWARAEEAPIEYWDQARELAGAWSQFHLEQRLRSLPFAATSEL